MRHLVHERLCETEMPPASRRRIPARQGYLAGDTAPALMTGNPGRRLIRATPFIQRRGRTRLPRRRGRLHPFQVGDALDQCCLVGVLIYLGERE
jgi:hypothetical protein